MALTPAQASHLADVVYAAVYQTTPNTKAVKALNYSGIAPQKLRGPLLSLSDEDISDMWDYVDEHQGPALPKPASAGDRAASKIVQDVYDAVAGANA